jgi:hypothetical protein
MTLQAKLEMGTRGLMLVLLALPVGGRSAFGHLQTARRSPIRVTELCARKPYIYTAQEILMWTTKNLSYYLNATQRIYHQ